MASASNAEHGDHSERARRLEALLASSPDAIVELDPSGDVLFVSRAAITLLPELHVGSGWLTGLPNEAHGAARRAFADAAAGNPAGFESARLGAPGRSTFIEHRLAPLRTAGVTVGVALIARDVTAARHAEAQRLVRDRLSSLGALAATVSHEINNPLAVLLMGLDLIKRDLDDKRANRSAASFRAELEDMHEAANRTRQVVADLRIFSRPDEERPARIDVRALLAAVVRLVRTDIRQRARLVENYGEVPAVEGSESRLGQVFLQLMLNAAQAIGEGDALDNEVRVETSVDTRGRVLVAIADSGAGIPREQQPRVLDPFFTTKPGNVPGVGLPLCAQLVASLGGHISFESEPGKGSVFRVALPAAARSSSPTAIQPATEQAPRRARVLVVDDESMVVSVVARFLGDDHEIVPALSARQAHDLISRGPKFDVILCDLMMPHMTGMELHALLSRTRPEQANRMVFMTAGAFTPRARMFLESVPNPRLEKPFDPQVLRVLVQRLAHDGE
jgi:PAS domain S-box-containing protein